MIERKYLKERGRSCVKKSYIAVVVVCFIFSILGLMASAGIVSVNNSMKALSEITGESIEEDFKVDMEENTNLYDKVDFYSVPNIIKRLFTNIYDGVAKLLFPLNFSLRILLGVIFTLFIQTILRYSIHIGKNNFFMINRESKSNIKDIFCLYKNENFSKSIITMLYVDIFIVLWSFLFFIPGVIKSFEYKLIPYIIAENPDIDRKRVFELSKYMMNGQKFDAFVLDLSFIGWNILSMFTFGILNIFYVAPYYEATIAELYQSLRLYALTSGFASEDELPGFSEEVNI